MNIRSLLLSLQLCLLCSLVYAASPIREDVAKSWVFPEDGVTFSTEFDRAHLNAIERTGNHRYTVSILPENTPINNSPWYAFSITTDQATAIALTLTYEDGTHRYQPKIQQAQSVNDLMEDRWTLYPEESMTLSEDETTAQFTLELESGTTFVAGQPILTLNAVNAWIKDFANRTLGTVKIFGMSVESRPLYTIEYGLERDKPTIIVVSGQHPPEHTGWIGMRAFCEELITPDFIKDYGVVIIPMANPDGYSRGHWRHNAQGLDTNRHWGDGWQAQEPKVIAEYLKTLDVNYVLFVDFHSTRKNVFYTFPDSTKTKLNGLKSAWLESIRNSFPGMEFPAKEGHNYAKKVSRLWAYETFGCDALTYEFADSVHPYAVKNISEVSARVLVPILDAFSSK